ncbi:hypothetical protein KGD83_19525 [Nocardiopsis akebiae]|uniref:Uncharacterized protein n=1 Tax=Nocardiopsis akebiae TaxID=2831968 RepID=A0ABX8C250_9ACTN|nr:hypothetical protein [Nocardiopsis akebiae]QUX27494.1 hypothetical protein KGD83_19525 [Nocardiopsis akebiae]
MGRDYARALTRHWNDPALGQHLRQSIGDRLPPHMRDHLSDVPVNLRQPLNDYFSTASAYAQQTGGSLGSGALEGYLGEGLGSLMDGRGWQASVWSATAGASQAGIQQGATDGALRGMDLLKTPPDLSVPPPPTEGGSYAGRGSETPAGGNGSLLFEDGADRWDEGSGAQNPGGTNREGEGTGRDGGGPDRWDERRPDGDGAPESSGQGTGNRDGVPEVDDVPDLISDTGSDYGDTDTDTESGGPEDRDRTFDDDVDVHRDEDAPTLASDPLKNPDPGKDPFHSADTPHPAPSGGPFHPGANDGPLTVNFLNAIVPDNPMTNPPPGTEQPTPHPDNTGDTGNNRDTGDTNPNDRPDPAPEQRHTPAPVAVAPPAGQTTAPPANTPQNTTPDNSQRPASSERDNGGRSPQGTNGDGARGTGESTPQSDTAPAPAPAPEQRTASEDVPPSPRPVAETGDDQHETGPRTQSAPPPQPAAESAGDQHDTGPGTESGPPRDTEDSGRTAPERDAERSDGRDEDASREDDRSQDEAEDRSGDDGRPDEGTDGSGDGQRPDGSREGSDGGKDRSGNDDGEPKGDGESVHGEDPAEEKDGREGNGGQTREGAPARMDEVPGEAPSRNTEGVPRERETPPSPPPVTAEESTREPVRTPVPTGIEAPANTREVSRPGSSDGEERARPPLPAPAPREDDGARGETSTRQPADTDGTEHAPPSAQPPPPERPAQHNTDTGNGTDGGNTTADTGGTRQREEPPPRHYPGSVTTDRTGTAYDIGYLLTSSLVNSSMVHAEHLRSFVDDSLTDDAGHVDAAVRDAVRERVDEQARRQTGVFFRPEGFSTTVTGADGSRWRADLRLNSSQDGFHHTPTRPVLGSNSTELKLVDEAGEANPAEGGGNHGGTKFVGLGFQVSPLLLGTVSGTDIGPRFTVSFSGGTRQRQTAETAASIHDGYSSYEIKGKPAVYVSDLTMSFDLTPLPRTEDGPARGDGPVDGDAPANGTDPADRAVRTRAESPNGVLLVLPGEVVANAGPRTIRLRDPFATEVHQRGRDDDARPAGPHSDKGHPVSVGDIRLSDGSSDKSFPDWIADHLWSPERQRGRWRSVVDTVTPGFVDKRRQEKLDAFRDQVGETFSEKSVRNNLPKMTSAPAVFTITDPSGTRRLVSVQSVPTSYEARPHTIQPAKYIKGNEAERAIGTSLRHTDFLGGSLGAGVSVDAGTPGGTHMVRADAFSVEGGLRGRGVDESTRSSSGSANRLNYGKTESSAYDVQRNYYVHFDGEPGTVYRFQGETVEILTVQEARILNGDEPSDKVPGPPAPVRTQGNTTAPLANTPGAAPGAAGDQRPGDGQRGDGRETAGRAEGEQPPEERPGNERDGNERDGARDRERGNGHDAERPPGDQPPGEERPRNERSGEPRPPRANLAQERPVTFHGSVPRDFTWPDGSQYRDVGGRQRTVYQQIAHEVLTGLADKRPGLVLPELARDEKNFARRPGHEETGPFTGSTREHRPFRRDHDVAVFNTHRVMDAISASVFKSGEDDLTLHGQPIHLIDTGRFDPSALLKPGEKVLRPPFVAVRVTADFSPLRHAGETTRGTGGEYAGASERTTADGSQTRRSVRVTTGAYVRRIDTVDAADNPSDGGVFSVSGQLNSTRGRGRGLGVKTQSEEIIQYAEDSSVWNSTVRFSAKLYENDDIGMVLGGDRPLGDRGHDLLDAPIEALATMDTPKAVPNGEGGGRDGGAPRATRIRPIPVDRAKEMIDGGTAPTPDGVRKRRDVTGTVRRWFGGGQDGRPPAGRAPAPATGPRDTTGNTPGVRTPGQRRAELIRDLGPTVEHVNTRFSTGDGNRMGSLLDASYENFSSVPQWETRDGVERTPGRFGFERKLRHFLVRGQGSRQFYENALSPENLAGNPALQSSGGARTRTEMSGGPLSPHDVRATTATRFDIDSVDRFEQSDGAIVWKDKNTLEVFTREGRRTDGTILATGGGRYNPNPVQPAGQTSGGTEPPPNSAGAPLIQLGPSAGKSLFDRYTNARPASKFSETVEFHPKIPMSYSFSASGRVTQAVEFVKHWSIGPTIPRAARYRGWQADVRDLVTGLIHIRDAHQSGLVQDRVEESGDGLVRVSQPEPDRPAAVRARPGFEESGKMVRPANPDEALRSLTDDLASQGWELTKDSRETILHTLNSHTGLNPNTGTPVTVKVRAIDHSIGDLNAPTTAPLSLDATVNLRLDRGDTEVTYLGGKTEYRQRQDWEDGDRFQRGGESSASAGPQGALLPQLPRSGGDQTGGPTPSSSPYLMGVYGDASAMNAHGDGLITRDTDKRSIGLTMETPYARVSSDTRLTIDLHISDKQGVVNTLTGETPGAGGRRNFTGTGGSGRVEALYPTPYLDISGAGNTTDGTVTTETTGDATTGDEGDAAGGSGTARPADSRTAPPSATGGTSAGARPTGGGQRTGDLPPPENPSHDHHASLPDMMRDWSRATDPGARGDFKDGVVMPVAVENNGRDVRDLAHVVVAKSLGWNPPADSVRDGRYTPRAIEQAAGYAADKLKLNSRNNAIDQSLNAIALKALFPQANAESGTELIEMGRTTWGIRAVPRPESARVIDFNPSVRLTDSSESSRTFSPFHNESSTATMGVDARPSGRTGTGPPTTAIHYGGANATGSSTSGGDTARGSKPKEPPHSDRVRTGPAYLVEIDTTWGIGVRSELRGPWYKRSARYVGDRTAAAGRYTAAKVRGVFGDRSTPAPPPSRPARWQRGETSAKVTVWVSHGDAVRLGLITPDNANRIAPLTERFAGFQKALGDAEKAYLEARLPLDAAASDRIASPDDPRIQQRYADLESTYEDRLEAFNAALRDWEAALRELRGGLNAPSSPPRPRTVSAPTLDTIQEEPPPPPPPQRGAPGPADDPAADPAAIELPDRNTGRHGTGTSMLDTLSSDFGIRPAEGPAQPRGEERVRPDGEGPVDGPGADGLLGTRGAPESAEEPERLLPDLSNGRPLLSANGSGLSPHGADLAERRPSDQPETRRSAVPEHADDRTDGPVADDSENLYEASDQDDGDGEEVPRVRWLDRRYPEASSLSRDERDRLSRPLGGRERAAGPPRPEGFRYEMDPGGPRDNDRLATQADQDSVPAEGADGPLRPSTEPGTPQERDRSDEVGSRRPRPAPPEDDAPDRTFEDAVPAFDGRRLSSGSGSAHGHGTDLRPDREPSSPAPDAPEDTRLGLERPRSPSKLPAEGDGPPPNGTEPAGGLGDQHAPAPAGGPSDPDAASRPLSPRQGEEGSRAPSWDRADTSRREGTAPQAEQAPTGPGPASDLFAFFDQELNGPTGSGNGRSARGATGSHSAQEAAAGSASADDGGRGTSAPGTGPAGTGSERSREQPGTGGGETANDPEHARDEEKEKDDAGEESADAPADAKDEHEDEDGDDGGDDEDRSGGNGGDRSGGAGGQDGSGDGDRAGGGDRSADGSWEGGREGRGEEDRSPRGGRRGGANRSRGGTPVRPGAVPGGDTVPGTEVYDGDDGPPPHDLPGTPVQRPSGSAFDEPRIRPSRGRDRASSGSAERENGPSDASGSTPSPDDFLDLLNPGSGFDQPPPGSVTDFLVMPALGDNGGSGNP